MTAYTQLLHTQCLLFSLLLCLQGLWTLRTKLYTPKVEQNLSWKHSSDKGSWIQSGTFASEGIAFIFQASCRAFIHCWVAKPFAWTNSTWLCMYGYLHNVNLKLVNTVCVYMCWYKWFIWLLWIYFMIVSVWMCVQVYFQVGMNVCGFSIPYLLQWNESLAAADERWVDINQCNWLQTEHRCQRSLKVKHIQYCTT